MRHEFNLEFRQTLEREILNEIKTLINEEINRAVCRAQGEIRDKIRQRVGGIAARLLDYITFEYAEHKFMIILDTKRLDEDQTK